MPTTVKSEYIMESWAEVIENGAGHANEVMQNTERLIIDANMPSVRTRLDQVSTGLFGQRRDFLIVTNDNLREYRMFITARDYGKMLDCAWFLTLEPRGLKRAISKAMTGNPQAFSMQVDMFAQQDIRAFATVATEMFKKALNDLLEELKLDPSILNKKSRGYLDIW